MNEAATKRTSFWDYANPTRFMGIADKLVPWLAAATAIFLGTGLYLGFTAPEDYQQGSTVLIMFIHVPATWAAMMCYAVMTMSAIGTLVWRHPLADISLRAAAPIGAAFTFLGLFTGSLWGKPMWGTYWVWDARLTSFLVLLIIYLGIIALAKAIEEPTVAARSLAIVTLIGFINIPIIKFSVDWWNTLHQPASVSRLAKPAMDAVFLYPLLLMAIAYSLLFLTLHLMNMRNEILTRRIRTMKMGAARQAERT
ncbi:MAG: heme ABC transporter permease [Rhizobiaceae bacterium]|nr:heme ABC transporter permease [Rhizobiaceae bacterium]